jgi:hypothetical protein
MFVLRGGGWKVFGIEGAVCLHGTAPWHGKVKRPVSGVFIAAVLSPIFFTFQLVCASG